jgi:hypothetical protein
MGRRRAGWIHLTTTKSERSKPAEHPPGEGGKKNNNEDHGKSFTKGRQRKNGVPQEGGHSQASIGEQENISREGGHSQSSNGINPHREKIDEGGHNQASTAKHMRYGHHGRYNDGLES